MKITHTLTLVVTGLLACGFVYSDEFRSLVGTSPRASRTVQQDGVPNRSRAEQFAQADGQIQGSNNPDKAESDSAAPQPAGAESRTPAEVLASATEKLRGYTSVRAKIAEKVAMQSSLSPQTYRFGATGQYLQGQNLKLRMSIEVKLSPELTGRLVEVCDGELLWSSYELGENAKPEITRRDVRQIMQALDQIQQGTRAPANDKALQQAGLVGSLGLGGLPALLAGLAKDFEFSKVVTEKIDSREVVTIEGIWNLKFREFVSANKKPKGKVTDPMPLNIPDIVRVSFDKETEFPRRIEYLKRQSGKSELSQLMVIDFTDPKFNERLGRDEFVFFPPNDAKPRDDTQQYIQRISALKDSPNAGTATKRAPAKAE